MTLLINLQIPDVAAFDKAVQSLYEPKSPTYEKWMTDADLQRYAPSAATRAAVKAELIKQGLRIAQCDPNGFWLIAQGPPTAVEAAFQVPVQEFIGSDKKRYRAGMGEPKLTGRAGSLVASVSGLHKRSNGPSPRVSRQRPSRPTVGAAAKKAKEPESQLDSLFTNECFSGPGSYSFKKQFFYGEHAPIIQKGTYTGNIYQTSPENQCGFSVEQVRQQYGLDAVYAKGWDGSGQTIILITDGTTSFDNLNRFSELNGLPLFDRSHFNGAAPYGGNGSSPNEEQGAIELEWTYAIAPGANIFALHPFDGNEPNLEVILNFIISHHLGNIVSCDCSYNRPESDDPDRSNVMNEILRRMAAVGISMITSSGSLGDYGKNGTHSPLGAPTFPGNSPYATAVGGTSILGKINGQTVETGWGTLQTEVGDIFGLLDPPQQQDLNNRYSEGSGGGESTLFAKPWWQAALGGTGRQVPDISLLADTYAGGIIVVGPQPDLDYKTGGGALLSTTIFSGIWALATQAAGHPLGQAAPRIARMTAAEVRDIRPLTSPTNVIGTIYNKNRFTLYSSRDLFSEATSLPDDFISALWPEGGGGSVISFGTDSSLRVTDGWDNVTGFGVPNGLAFVEAAGR